LALRFAQAINCTDKDLNGNPCGNCRICRQTMRMEHPDLSVVALADDKTEILVEQVRELQHVLSRSPFEARYRVGLLLDFEKANANAQNALLKTLEEAPTQVILMMTVDTVDNLLPTIVSRCEILRLRSLELARLETTLAEQFDLSSTDARLLAHVSGGRVGEALKLQQLPELMETRKQWLDEMIEAMHHDRNHRMDYAEKKFRHGGREQMRIAGQIWLTFWRDVAMRASGDNPPLLNPDYEAEIDQVAQSLGLQTAVEFLQTLHQSMEKLDDNVNIWMLADVVMLQLPDRA
jgi:DNA polymerase-3 subunit delta'